MKVAIGKKRAHAANLALVMAWIHAVFAVVTTQVVLTVQEYHVQMRM